jgi:Flp pilus assembly protein TadD
MAVGMLVIVIALLPVLGMVPFDFQIYSTVADHYLYLPMLGVALVVAWAASNRVAQRLAIVIVAALGVATALQSRTWKDSHSLFTQALRVNPQSWASHNNLATALIGSGQLEEAIRHCQQAAGLNPRYAMAYDNMGHAQLELGRAAEAEASYRRASELEPTDVRAWTGLGHALSSQKRLEEAETAYRRAAKLAPQSVMTLTNLASILAEKRNFDEAIELYRRALAINPADLNARVGLDRATREMR